MSAGRGPLLIAGAGIAGLASAIALAQRGIASHLLERREAAAEDGAGIQIGPNGTRILSTLGVAQPLAPLVGRPEAIVVRSGTKGAMLARLPLGDWIAARHGAPYWTTHRQDLHAALLARARALPAIKISYGAAVTDVTIAGAATRVMLADGRSVAGAGLIGADGLWSTVRGLVHPGSRPRATGKAALRTVIPFQSMPPGLDAASTQVWLMPGTHVVHYGVRGGREIAVVIITADRSTAEMGYGRAPDLAQLAAMIASFPLELRALLAAAPGWRTWSLYDGAAPLPWSRGPVTLVGDAAHPIGPFLAQGGVLALEDTQVLADCVATRSSLIEAFARYQQLRHARAARVARASTRNGRIYQLSGPAAWARDRVLAALPGERVMAGYDWLYGRRGDVADPSLAAPADPG